MTYAILPWLIWATCNPFPKTAQKNPMWLRVLNTILYLIFQTFRKRKARVITLFNALFNKHVIICGHVIYLLKSKLIVFKLIVDRKHKLWWFTFTSCFPRLISDQLYLIHLLFYLLFIYCWLKKTNNNLQNKCIKNNHIWLQIAVHNWLIHVNLKIR